MILLPIAKYTVGIELPPHLSPWVDNEEEGYTPRYAVEIARMKSGEEGAMEDASDDEEEEEEDEAMGDVQEEDGESSAEESEEEEDAATAALRKEKAAKNKADEVQELAKIMMSKKATRLYGRMQNGINEKASAVDKLVDKRKALERESSKKRKIIVIDNTEADDIAKLKDARGKPLVKEQNDIGLRKNKIGTKKRDEEGRTPALQKVKRLKDERKKMDHKYGAVVKTKEKALAKNRRGGVTSNED
jgi:hypothetical protein